MTPKTASPRLWRNAPSPYLDSLQQAWLCQPGALTAGLRKLGQVRLFVCREATLALPASWAAEAGLQIGSAIWWREILMTVNGLPSVQACSFTSWHGCLGAWKAMRGLGSRPLADILYQDPRIARSPFRFGRLHAHQTGVPGATTQANAPVEARHSVFMRLGQPLLVAEYFLPTFWALAGQSGATGPRRRFPLCEYALPARPA
ncbi:chorismate--pyruvate lyase family protein [Castellaniella sp.]|uniref:chorismate--pyruvate lyase family protein n=1 Tax=Castellaniella sp. TaxID=1955812 RepID=UPI002AFF218D|nr:chorismate lyase [Castellaniella sp.]